MSRKYQRPFNTTANPEWMHANSARDLVPFMDEDDEDADLFVKLAGKFLLTQGQEAGRRLEDVWLPWQKDALRLAYQSRESMWLLGKGPLALDTPIATPDGWSTMGDLQVGDQVFATDGTPTLVVGTSETFTDRQCYRLTFSDGTSIVADAEHRWQTTPRKIRDVDGIIERGATGEPITCTTEYIAKTLRAKRSGPPASKATYNHRICTQVRRVDGVIRKRADGKDIVITSCEPVASVATKCITIAHPSHLFLAGEGMIPTCNSGKSLSAGAFALAICMFHALKGRHSRGLIVCLAPSIPTARVVFDHIMEAILADEELRPLFASNVQDRSLTHKESGIKIQVLACEMKAAVGRRPIALIIDELHEIGRLNEGLAVTNQLRQGGRNAGTDFKVLSISTMSTGEPRGEFARALKYATKVRDGEIDDPTYAPLLYMFPLKEREDLDPLDPSEWWRGMPSLRTAKQPGTMDAVELEKELNEAAAAEDAESFGLLLSQRLGIQKNIDAQNAESILHGRWLDADKCSVTVPAMEPDAIWTIGVDAGGLDDPLAVTLLVGKTDGALEIRPHQFLTQEGYDRAHASTRAVYDAAIAFGTLHVRPSAETMDAAVYAKIREILDVNAWAAAGGDEHGRAGFKARFEASVATFKSVPQTWVLGGSLANLEAALVDGRVRHPHCPLLNANVANLAIEETPNGNRRLGKKDGRMSGQGHAKIDGVMAMLSGMHLQTEQEVLSGDIGGMIG